MDARARLTIIDIGAFAASFAVFAVLSIPYYATLNDAAGSVDDGLILLGRAIPPLALLVMYTLIYNKATAGVNR